MSEKTPLFPARVTVVLSTGHKLDVAVTDDEAAKVIKLLTKFAKEEDRANR